MSIVATPEDSPYPGVASPDGAVLLRRTGREEFEAHGILGGMLAFVLGFALRVGAELPIGQ